jgi:hypothetical protein
MASMLLMELDGFYYDNLTSFLEIITERFPELPALLRSNCLLCVSPCYLLMLSLGLSLAYFGCHVLVLRVEESLEVTIFVVARHVSERKERYEDTLLATSEYICYMAQFKTNSKHYGS